MNQLHSSAFTYDKATRSFTAEVSELTFRGDLGRGFYIKSARTGEQRLFLYEKTDFDASGEDIAGWHFICPGEGLRALIIND